jgi:23S rRNA pseudouridine1911/1915/1917 synthase
VTEPPDPPDDELAAAAEPDEGSDEDDAGWEAASETEHRIAIDASAAGGRLDTVIAARIASLSRAMVQRLIDAGHVRIGTSIATKSGHRVRAGEVIEVTVPPPASLEALPEAIPLSILFEDEDLIVIDKPAGMVVHPAPGHYTGTLVNALLHHCQDLSGIGGVLRPGIVHRLDKDTSGVIVVAKSDYAHTALTLAFVARSRGEPGAVSREYLAIAAPPPPAPRGTLRTLYGRHPIHRKRFSSKVADGKAAVTHYEVVESFGGAALVRLRLETGRTHQIRVHAADHGWPLLGDPVYGPRPRDPRLAAIADELGRQALHAARLELDHPLDGEHLTFEAPLPADFERALAALRALH